VRGAPYASALGLGARAVHARVSDTSGVTDRSDSVGLPGTCTFRFPTPRSQNMLALLWPTTSKH